ncbi:MAG: LysR family transcriptional regulator [Sphingobium sp.]|jgi:DNA-binding transcriptional LysR family regulator|nr:LysR family transcriptional regulator [Sphingobium sp.]MCI1271815.1 LysR family transcriptional regulator [Sphingobium sp.]MCI1756177.1 LysR family transcriptional regulator [Sphingobium sp.]MCI2054239.1 LysR family transcriptional regulator [Sphingobium sp.]
MPINVRQLRYAIAAADHRSFHGAARTLGIEQSSLSRHIRTLERVAGVTLFVRTRSGVNITSAGIAFMHSARSIVAQSDRMISASRSAGKGHSGMIAVGHNSAMSAGHLRTAVIDWNTRNPETEIKAIEGNRSILHAGLRAGSIDFVVLPSQINYDDMKQALLWREPMMVALPICHHLAGQQSVEWAALKDETLMFPTHDLGAEIRDIVMDRLPPPDLCPEFHTQEASHASILSMLGEAKYITITTEAATGAQYPGVVFRKLHDPHGPVSISYSGYWSKINQNPALRRFLNYIRKRYALSFEPD